MNSHIKIRMKNKKIIWIRIFMIFSLIFTFFGAMETMSPVLASEKVSGPKMLKTNKDIVEEFGKNMKRFRKNINLYISKDEYKVFKDFRGKKNEEFWNMLYTYPEYNDLFWSSVYDSKNSLIYDYGTYWVWTIKIKKYLITKTEKKIGDKYAKKWVKKHLKKGMTEEEKVREINDFMIKEFRYHYGDKGEKWFRKHGNNGHVGKYSIQTSYALIFKKGGVCNAKANLFTRLAREAGLRCRIVIGFAGGELHAWNLVKIKGKWYHVDVTWGRGTYDGSPEGEYFNDRSFYLKSDKSMRANGYKWQKKNYPKAKKDYPEVPDPKTALQNERNDIDRNLVA